MYEPEKLEEYAEKIYMRYEYFNDYALQTIGRRIKATGKLSAYDQQTLKNMADISGDMKEITKQLAEITKMNVADIEAVYTQVISGGADTYKPLYDFKGMKFVPFSQNEFTQQLVKSWAVRTAGEMINLSQTKALCFDKYNAFGEIIGSIPLQGAYEQAMSEAVQAVSAGTVDFNTAMKKTVERLGGSGVKVNYGNGVTRNLSSAIRQNILWGAKQSAKDYEKHVSDELGMDGFEVDAHPGCRPTHLFMQGKMYSYNGRKVIDGVVYEDGTEALARLEDYGCLHYKTGVLLGVSVPRYSEEELDQIYKESTELIEYNGKEKTLYEWKQTQRRLERETKKAVQQSNMFKAAGNNREAERYTEKSAAYRRTYDDLCKKLNLPPKLERMAVYADKSLTNSGGGGIINKKAYTKIDNKDIPSMDESKFTKIKSRLESNGIKIIQDKDGDAYLKSMNAEAITLSDGSAIIFQSHRVPSASACFEEIIHTTQIRLHGSLNEYGDRNAYVEYLNREIEANEKVLKYSKAYGLTDLDVKSIKINLTKYYEALEEVE